MSYIYHDKVCVCVCMVWGTNNMEFKIKSVYGFQTVTNFFLPSEKIHLPLYRLLI